MQHQHAIERLLTLAADAGADAEIVLDCQQRFSLKAKKGELDEQSLSDTSVIGLRLYRDQRIGLAYSEAFDDQALQTLVQQALDSARYCQPDGAHQLLPLDHLLHSDDSLTQPGNGLSLDEGSALLLDTEQRLLQQPLIQSLPYNGLGQTSHQRLLVNSHGLHAQSHSRSLHLYAYALASNGQETAMEGQVVAGRQPHELDSDWLIEQVAKEAAAMLSGKSVASGRFDVLFSLPQLASLLDAFALAFSGKAAVDGINPWRQKIGQAVASPLLNLIDRPLESQGLGYQLFDAEGVACHNQGVLVNGELQGLLHNSFSAQKLGLNSSGHASRSAKGNLGISAHQWYLPPGTSSAQQLRQGQYLEITGLQGLHSGANAISGDFSFGASGYLCRDGERVQAVRGITLAGNFYQLLQQIAAIGDRSHWHPNRSCCLADVRFQGLQVAS